MLTELEKELIMSNFFDNGSLYPNNRPKTMKAIFRVMEQIPTEERWIIINKVTLILAPERDELGAVIENELIHNK